MSRYFGLGGLLLLLALSVRPSNPPAPMASGEFHPVAHKGSGTVAIYRSRQGLVLEMLLQTSFRPDLVLYLTDAQDAHDNETVKNATRLVVGPVRDTAGRQTFLMDPGVEVGRYRSATVWSAKYGVNFTTAPLVLYPIQN